VVTPTGAPHATAGRATDFPLLATGQVLSWLGDGFQTVALAVAVVIGGGGAGALGLVMASRVVALLACTLLGGIWADRLQPTRVMMTADTVRALAVGGMAALFVTGALHVPALCALAAVTGGAGAFFSPAMTALQPLVVPAGRRQRANATLGLLRNACMVAGPAAGGVAVATLGAGAGFTVNALSYVASAASVSLIGARTRRGTRRGLLGELRDGWHEVRRRDWLMAGMLAAAIYHIANGVILVLVPVIAVGRLGGAAAVGAIATAQGFGGVLGAAVALRVRPTRPLFTGWAVLQLMPIGLLAFVGPAPLPVVLVGAAAGFAGLMFYDVQWTTAVQDHVPLERLARVESWDLLASFAAMPVGNALAGPVASALGTSRAVLGCVAVLAVACAVPVLVPGSRRLTRR